MARSRKSQLYVLPRREDKDSLFADIHYLIKGVVWSTTVLGKTHEEEVYNIIKFVRSKLKEDKIQFSVKFVSPWEIEKLLKARRRNEIKKTLKKIEADKTIEVESAKEGA